MFKLYHVFPCAIPVSKCEDIVRRGNLLPLREASIGFSDDRLDESYRVSSIGWFPYQLNDDIRSLLFQHALEANREYFGFDISFNCYDLQFTTYHGSKNGKYDWHHDVFWENQKPYDRKLSVVVQLSNPQDYEGGDFEFRGPHNPSELRQFKQQGSILVFPSFFEHRVTPVTSGRRSSLVTWVDGPKFR